MFNSGLNCVEFHLLRVCFVSCLFCLVVSFPLSVRFLVPPRERESVCVCVCVWRERARQLRSPRRADKRNQSPARAHKTQSRAIVYQRTRTTAQPPPPPPFIHAQIAFLQTPHTMQLNQHQGPDNRLKTTAITPEIKHSHCHKVTVILLILLNFNVKTLICDLYGYTYDNKKIVT